MIKFLILKINILSDASKKQKQRRLHFSNAYDPQQKADPSLILAYI